MNYSLGNMLSRGGALNPDGLSLDLAFALDKTLTARKGPTPTFTRGSTGTFIGSNGLIQSAAINEPRFDHDPVTGICRGLLIEEGGRTNLAQHSQDFSQAFYGKTGVSIASVAGTSPSGGTTIQKIVEDTSTGGHGLEWALSPSGTFTLSVFVKASERQWIRLTAASINSWFDLQNGVVGTIGAGHTASITNFGNGWYRCAVTFTTTVASSVLIRIATGNNNITYTGDGTSGIFLWGAQLEPGSFPTSYIPTTTTALTRSADVCSITGADFTSFYNQSEGTVFVSGAVSSNNSLPVPFQSSDGTNANRVRIGMTNVANEAVRPFISAGSVGTYSSFFGTSAINVNRKIATAYQNDDAISAFNGTLGLQDTTVTVPTVTNIATIGLTYNGHIARIQYFRKRLPNAKLQSLTTA